MILPGKSSLSEVAMPIVAEIETAPCENLMGDSTQSQIRYRSILRNQERKISYQAAPAKKRVESRIKSKMIFLHT